MVSLKQNSKNLSSRDLQATKIILEQENKEALEESGRIFDARGKQRLA